MNSKESNVHGIWTARGETRRILRLARHDLARQRELDRRVVQLGDGRAAAVLGGDGLDL